MSDQKKERKNIVGNSMMSWSLALCQALFTTFLTFYITEYLFVEQKSYGVILIISILPVLKIVDACTDMVQGWIMDHMVCLGRFGYKFFCRLGIILMTISALLMFTFTGFIEKKSTLVVIPWVVVAYLLYDFGSSFYADSAMKQTLSTNTIQRMRYISSYV